MESWSNINELAYLLAETKNMRMSHEGKVDMRDPRVDALKNAPAGTADRLRYLVLEHLQEYLISHHIKPVTILTCSEDYLKQMMQILHLRQALQIATSPHRNIRLG